MSESSEQLNVLEEQHRMLKQEVKRLERRAHLTPTEQRHVSELKKQKLAAKDQIVALKNGRD